MLFLLTYTKNSIISCTNYIDSFTYIPYLFDIIKKRRGFMKKKSKATAIFIYSMIFLIGISIGYYICPKYEVTTYGDSLSFVFEGNIFDSVSVDFKNNAYYFSDKGGPSQKGKLKKIDEYIFKFETGHLENGYLILARTDKEQIKYINKDGGVSICKITEYALHFNGGVDPDKLQEE